MQVSNLSKRLSGLFSKCFQKYIYEQKQHDAKLNDLDRFNDDFAKSISWTPVVKSRIRTGFSSKRLVKSKNSRVSIKPSIQFLLFNLFFIGVPGFILLKCLVTNSCDPDDKYLIIPFMSLFILVGVPYLVLGSRPIYFDLNFREFKKYTFKAGYERISLDDIYSLQMIADISSQDETYYELNLVLRNKDRVNIICHKNDKTIRKQAEELSEILTIQFWDKTNY